MIITRRKVDFDNVVDIRPIMPKSNHNPPANKNWLADLPVGSIFLSRPNNEYSLTTEYTILEKTVADTLLRENKREGKLDISIHQWFDTLNFSLKNTFRSILS